MIFRLEVMLRKLEIYIETYSKKKEILNYIKSECVDAKAEYMNNIKVYIYSGNLEVVKNNKEWFDKRLYKFIKSYSLDGGNTIMITL